MIGLDCEANIFFILPSYPKENYEQDKNMGRTHSDRKQILGHIRDLQQELQWS